jgi:hypothetical protein
MRDMAANADLVRPGPEPIQASATPDGPASVGADRSPHDGIDFEIIIGLPDDQGAVPISYVFANISDAAVRTRRIEERAVARVVRTALAGAHNDAPLAAVAKDIARALVPRLRLAVRSATVPHDDAFVDQDEGLFDRETYLRLARKGAFAVEKHGKKRIARWGDVKAGFIQAGARITLSEPTDDPDEDLLNEIRRHAGLAVRGGR